MGELVFKRNDISVTEKQDRVGEGGRGKGEFSPKNEGANGLSRQHEMNGEAASVQSRRAGSIRIGTGKGMLTISWNPEY